MAQNKTEAIKDIIKIMNDWDISFPDIKTRYENFMITPVHKDSPSDF